MSRLCLRAADRFRELHLADMLDDYRHYAARILIDSDFLRALKRLKPPASVAAPAADYAREEAKAARDDRGAIASARAGDAIGFQAALARARHDSRSVAGYAKKIGARGCCIG